MNRTRRVKKKRDIGFWGWFWIVWKWIILSGLLVGVAGLIIGISFFAKYSADTPTLNLDKLGNPGSSLVYDINGELLAEVGAEPRIETTVDAVPVEFMEALIAVEDSRFFYHKGIDPIRIGKAGLTAIMGNFGAEGGSTLTQQLVKLSFLDPNEQSLARKAKEAVLAWNLEQVYTKEQILTTYINKVYMGDGVYGVETAAQHYYGKTLSELSIPQLALLAGIPQNPSQLNPYVDPEYAKERRDTVLYRMWRIGVITEEDYKAFAQVDIMDGVLPVGKAIYKGISAQHQEYMDQVMTQLSLLGYKLTDKELRIYTTLDRAKQETLNNALYTNEFRDWAGENLEATVAIVSNKDGHVIAIGGGNSETKKLGQVDGFSYPVQGRLQPGSTIKTVLDYAPALDLLDLSMQSMIEDKPISYSSGQEVNNFDFAFQGQQTLQEALQGSRNSPALQLMQWVGVERSYQFANDLGLNVPQDQWLESGAIGGINIAFVDLANAYSTIAKYGVRHDLTYISKITDKEGNVLWQQNTDGRRVMREDKARDLVQTLRTIVQAEGGFGRFSRVDGYDIGGKTGTNNYGEDEELFNSGLSPSVAYVGITPDITIAIQVEGAQRSRGLRYPEETEIPQYLYKYLLPKFSNDLSKFE